MTNKPLAVVLRTLLALGVLLTLVVQVVVLPWMSGQMARDFPEVAYMRWPVLAGSIMWLLCLEITFVAIWKLLDAVRASHIFDPRSFYWIDMIVWSLAAATVLTIAFFICVLVTSIGPITVPVFCVLAVLAMTGLLLLMITLRSLLHRASELQGEMESVI